MKTIYILVILFIGSLNLHSATVEVDGLEHQPNLECPSGYILDISLLCVHGDTGEEVKPIKVSNIEIKGNGEECRVAIDSKGEIIFTNCLQLTNSKKVEILCTKNKKMCKTKNELYITLKNSDDGNLYPAHVQDPIKLLATRLIESEGHRANDNTQQPEPMPAVFKCIKRIKHMKKYLETKDYCKAYVYTIRASDVCSGIMDKKKYQKLIKLSISLERKILKKKYNITPSKTANELNKKSNNTSVYDECLEGQDHINNNVVSKCSSVAKYKAEDEITRLYNIVYKKIQKQSKVDAKAFENSQKLWRSFQEEHCQLMGSYVGSPMYSYCPMQLAEERVLELKELAGEY